MTISLLTWLLLPSALMVSLTLSSFSAGLLVSSTIILTLVIIKQQSVKISVAYLVTSVISLIWTVGNNFSMESGDQTKPVLTILLLLLCGFAVTSMLKQEKEEELQRSLKIVFWTLIFIGLAGTLSLLPLGPYQHLNRPLPPFSEPSHFALIYAPIACSYALVCKKALRPLVCLISLFLSLTLPNLTLLIATVLVSTVSLSNRQILTTISASLALSVALIASGAISIDYFLNRITDPDAENLSRLVYTQGWESIASALRYSYGLGVGFQNLGSEPPGQAAATIEALTAGSLNRLDGGFLAAKIIGEFGIVGMILVFSTTVVALISGLELRRQITRNISTKKDEYIPLCFTYTIVLELFFRGTGYFSPSFLMFLYFLPKALKSIRMRKSSRALSDSQSMNSNFI